MIGKECGVSDISLAAAIGRPVEDEVREESEKSVRVDDVVGIVEIAQRLCVREHNVVNNWWRRHSDFP